MVIDSIFDFGENENTITMLKCARKSKGMTQQQVADAAGIRLRPYQRFEYGERDLAGASFRIAFAICKALDIDPEEILRDAVDE